MYMFDLNWSFPIQLFVTFKHHNKPISWRPVFIGGGSRRKTSTFDGKADNPSQLRFESSAPARPGFELTTSVLTG